MIKFIKGLLSGALAAIVLVLFVSVFLCAFDIILNGPNAIIIKIFSK